MNNKLRIGLFLVAAISMPLVANSYVSLEWGLTTSHSTVDVDVIHINHPTYCDTLLYTASDTAPTDGACATNIRGRSYAGLFTPDAGWLASAAYGRNFGSWRVEGRYERNQFGSAEQLLPLATSGDSAILSKTNEWSQFTLPNNSYVDQGSSILDVTVLRDFQLNTNWSAYVGASVGVALLNFNYGNEFLRKTVDEGYLDVPFPIQWPTAAKLNAAGTLSKLNTTVQKSTMTYNLMAGIDFHHGPNLTLGVRLTWRVIGEVEHDKALWTTIRSHTPVIADGRTPFESDFVFQSWSYLKVGFVVTRRIGRVSR